MYAILFLIGLMSQSNVSANNTLCDIGTTRYSRYMYANTDSRLNATFSKQTIKEYIDFLPNTTDEVYADCGWCLSKKNKLWKCVQEPDGNVYYRRNRNGIKYSFATSNRRYGVSFLLSGGGRKQSIFTV